MHACSSNQVENIPYPLQAKNNNFGETRKSCAVDVCRHVKYSEEDCHSCHKILPLSDWRRRNLEETSYAFVRGICVRYFTWMHDARTWTNLGILCMPSNSFLGKSHRFSDLGPNCWRFIMQRTSNRFFCQGAQICVLNLACNAYFSCWNHYESNPW